MLQQQTDMQVNATETGVEYTYAYDGSTLTFEGEYEQGEMRINGKYFAEYTVDGDTMTYVDVWGNEEQFAYTDEGYMECAYLVLMELEDMEEFKL